MLGWLLSFGKGLFSGAMLVFGRVSRCMILSFIVSDFLHWFIKPRNTASASGALCTAPMNINPFAAPSYGYCQCQGGRCLFDLDGTMGLAEMGSCKSDEYMSRFCLILSKYSVDLCVSSEFAVPKHGSPLILDFVWCSCVSAMVGAIGCNRLDDGWVLDTNW